MKRKLRSLTSSAGEPLAKIIPPPAEPPALTAHQALMEKSPDSEGQLRFTAAGYNLSRLASGCNSIELGRRFLRQAVPNRGESLDQSLRLFEEAGSFLANLGPTDAIEGALATQLYALHTAAMRSMSQAAAATEERCVDLYHNRAVRLLRVFSQLLTGWNRNRRRGQQTVRFEQLHVNDGGQAIVGTVNAGVGSPSEK